MSYNTKQKKLILSFFKAHPDKSFTPDGVLLELGADSVGKSSVYRICATLAEEGVIKRMTDESGRKTTYQLMECHGCGEHLHLKCRGCGRLVHLDEKTSHSLESNIMSLVGFELDCDTMLYGTCPACLGSEG